MKFKLLFAFLLASVFAVAQPTNYQNVASRYNWIAGRFNDGFHIPGYATIPNLRTGVWPGAGNIGLDTVAHKFYFYSGGVWREAGAAVDSLIYATRSRLQQKIDSLGAVIDNSYSQITSVGDSGVIFEKYNGLKDTVIFSGTSTPSVSTTTVIQKNDDIVRIKDGDYYTAFAFSCSTGDTAHIFASQGTTHIDRMWIKHFWSVDNFKTIEGEIIMNHADTSYRDAGGGVGPDGKIYLFVTKYIYTAPGNYVTDPKINLYINSGNNYPIYQYELPLAGNGGVTAYGKMITVEDTMIMSAYGDNIDVLCYKGQVGGQWSHKSNIYSGADQNNETCLEVIGTNTIVGISRTSGLAPKMFISHDKGMTWTNTGSIYNGTANNVSPWLQKLDDETLSYTFADRSSASYQLSAFEYNVAYLDTATATTASTNSFIRRKSFYEPILNNRNTTANVGGHFGYPSIYVFAGEYYILFNDLDPLQDDPYGGDDDVTTDIVIVPYYGKVMLKAFNAAVENFTADAETRIAFSKGAFDNYGILDANSNITIPKDGMYAFGAMFTLNNTTGGRRILMIRKVAAYDTATVTNRKVLVYKEYSAGGIGSYQTVDANSIYYFQKGEVIKLSFLIYGASGNVSTVFTQQMGGANEGIYNGFYLYLIN